MLQGENGMPSKTGRFGVSFSQCAVAARRLSMPMEGTPSTDLNEVLVNLFILRYCLVFIYLYNFYFTNFIKKNSLQSLCKTKFK